MKQTEIIIETASIMKQELDTSFWIKIFAYVLCISCPMSRHHYHKFIFEGLMGYAARK
jgi:hypothetical protein